MLPEHELTSLTGSKSRSSAESESESYCIDMNCAMMLYYFSCLNVCVCVCAQGRKGGDKGLLKTKYTSTIECYAGREDGIWKGAMDTGWLAIDDYCVSVFG